MSLGAIASAEVVEWLGVSNMGWIVVDSGCSASGALGCTDSLVLLGTYWVTVDGRVVTSSGVNDSL